ncbi:hypothetical protein CHS0354_024967 [Potamilus streckersoni]|uniref:Uncharacterized protein n=1 Tax=Potamilus streckersoni TaxID=2493646 RepID=A0AAE0T2I9_9BIVA|nr:hypothetical protein CHS0354_024967 [Potamilus streckersoni]
MDVVDDDQSLSLNDILLQRSEEKDEFTAGSTRCKKGDKCKPGFLGSYTCETDYGWGMKCGVQVESTMLVVVMLEIELPKERRVFHHIIAGFTKNFIYPILTIIGAILQAVKSGDFVVARVANVPIRVGGTEINVIMPIHHIPINIVNVEFKCVTQGKLIG